MLQESDDFSAGPGQESNNNNILLVENSSLRGTGKLVNEGGELTLEDVSPGQNAMSKLSPLHRTGSLRFHDTGRQSEDVDVYEQSMAHRYQEGGG